MEQNSNGRVDLTLFDYSGQPLRNETVHYAPEEYVSLVVPREARTNDRGELTVYLEEGFYTFQVFSVGEGFQLYASPGRSPQIVYGPYYWGWLDIRIGHVGYPPTGVEEGGSGGDGDPGDPGDPGGENGDPDDGEDPEEDPDPIEYHSLKVSVQGLNGSLSVKNEENSQTMQIHSSGTHNFASALADGTYYSVAITQSPAGQNCSIQNSDGHASISMVPVAIACNTPEPTYKISGVVEGLYRHIYINQESKGEYIQVWEDAGETKPFEFRNRLRAGDSYNVRIPYIPFNFTCEIENGEGTVTDHDVSDIRILCTEPEAPEPQEPVTVSTLVLENVQYLYGIDYAPNGYLYLSHNGQSVIKVHPDTGQVWVVLEEGPENGNPEFDTITGITVGPDGTIYLNDTELFTTYSITRNYDISVFLEQFVAFTAFDLDVGPDGNVYIADYGNERILKVDQEGNHSVIAELGTRNPMGLVVSEDGTVYFTVAQESNVYQLKFGIVSRLAGADGCGFKDGLGIHAHFCSPDGLAIDADGNILVADRFNNAIRRVTPDGLVTTVAGNGQEGDLDGPGSEATFESPRSITALPDGRIAVTAWYGAIRIITPDE